MSKAAASRALRNSSATASTAAAAASSNDYSAPVAAAVDAAVPTVPGIPVFVRVERHCLGGIVQESVSDLLVRG